MGKLHHIFAAHYRRLHLPAWEVRFGFVIIVRSKPHQWLPSLLSTPRLPATLSPTPECPLLSPSNSPPPSLVRLAQISPAGPAKVHQTNFPKGGTRNLHQSKDHSELCSHTCNLTVHQNFNSFLATRMFINFPPFLSNFSNSQMSYLIQNPVNFKSTCRPPVNFKKAACGYFFSSNFISFWCYLTKCGSITCITLHP